MELQIALKISLYFIFHDFFMKHVFLEISSPLNIYVMEHRVVRNIDRFVSLEYTALFHIDFKSQLPITRHCYSYPIP